MPLFATASGSSIYCAHFTGPSPLHFASVYHATLSGLMAASATELQLPTDLRIKLPQLGLVGAVELESNAISLLDVLAHDQSLLDVPSLSAQSPRLRAAIAHLSARNLEVLSLRDQLLGGIQAAAYHAVQVEIEKIRTELGNAAEGAVIDYISAELELEPETVQQILALREFFSDKQALKTLEITNLKAMNALLFKILMITIQCLCAAPTCSILQIVCTADFFYKRLAHWKPDWEGLLKWGAETAAAAYGFDEAQYLAELAEYAALVSKAVQIYHQFE